MTVPIIVFNILIFKMMEALFIQEALILTAQYLEILKLVPMANF